MNCITLANIGHISFDIQTAIRHSSGEYKFKGEAAQRFRKTDICPLNQNHGFGILECCIFKYEIGI
jgi:hypothetical protein